MFLKPRADFVQRPDWFTSGLFLHRDVGQLVVAAVMGRSPAADAGVRAGDALIKVDDQNVSGMEAWRAAKLLRADHAKQITLSLERSRQPYTVTVVLVQPQGQPRPVTQPDPYGW
jgi:carboxyl-terminal processing protease